MAERAVEAKAPPPCRKISSISDNEHFQPMVELDKNEDKHATSYNPTKAKWVSLINHVASNIQPSKGRPPLVKQLTYAEILGLDLSNESLRIGVPYTFKVSFESSVKGKLELTCRPTEAAKLKVKSEHQVHVCTIIPKVLGVHEISMEHKGRAVEGSPFQVTFNPPADASKCHMIESLPECTGDLPESDVLFCVSTHGAKTGILSAFVKLASSRKHYFPIDLTMGPSEDHYHIRFTPGTETRYILSITYDRQHIPGSPFAISLSDASKCKAKGKGLHVAIAGQESSFKVRTQHAGPGTLTAKIEGEGSALKPAITAVKSEVYEVRYMAEQPGAYTIAVMYESVPIPGSPFTLTCLEPPDASKCVVPGPHFPVSFGKPVSIWVDTSNAGTGELTVKATGKTTGDAEVQVEKFEDDYQNIVFNPPTPDVYTLSVTWGNESIPGSPFQLSLFPPKPEEVFVAEPPASTLKAGLPIKIGFDCSKAGLGELTASCRGRQVGEIEVQVTKRSDTAMYDIQTVPPDEDIYAISVQWAGQHIKGSPFSINLIPIDVTKINSTGPTQRQGREGPVELTMHTEGAGLGKVTARAIGSQAGNVPVAIEKVSNYSYQVKFQPPKPDIYTLSVLYGGERIPGCPYYINTNPPNARGLKVTQPAVPILSCPMVYKCNATDAGAGNISATCQGDEMGKVEVSISKHGIAQFIVAYTPTQPDVYNLSIMWEQEHVPGSPFEVNLLPIDITKVQVGELQVPALSGVGRDACSLELDCGRSGPGEVTADCKGRTVGTVPVEVISCGDYKFQVSFKPTEHDIFDFSVFFADQHLPGSPFSINLLIPQPEKVKHISTWIAEDDDLTVPASIAMDVSEAGSGRLQAIATGLMVGPVPVEMEEAVPGQVTILLSLPKPDIYTVHVSWAGLQVPDSPFTISTKPPDVTRIKTEGPVVVPTSGEVELDLFAEDAGRGKVKASVIGSLSGQVPVSISETAKDCYKLTFHPPQPDVYTFGVWYGRELVPDAPFFINTHPPNASEVKVMQPEAIQCYKTVLYRCDASNAGTGELAVECVGKESGSVAVNLQRKGAAKYLVSLTFPRPDVYSLSITWAGKHVAGSPFRINLLPIDITKVQVGELQVPALTGVCRDACSLELDCGRSGPGEVTADCKGRTVGTVPVEVISCGDYKFRVSFKPTEHDIFDFSVFFADQHLPGSPFSINLLIPQPEKVKHISTWIAEDDDLTVPASIAMDVSEAGGGSLEATATGLMAGPVPVEMEEAVPGQVTILLSLPKPDIYTVHVSWAGLQVPDSPFTISTKPPDVTRIKTEGPVVVPTSGEVELDLFAEDAGRGKVKASVIGSLSGQVPVSISETAKDCYKLAFHPPQPDVYMLSVWYGQELVPDAPFFVNTHPPNASEVKVMQPEAIQCYKTVLYRCDASNAGTGELAVECVGKESGSVAVDLQRKGAAKYLVSLTFPRPDVYSLSITWAGKHVAGSPFRINLLPIDITKVQVGELQVPALSGVGRDACSLELDCGRSGPGEVTADCKGRTVGTVPVEVISCGDYKFRVSFKPTEHDIFDFSVFFADQHLPGSPFSINLLIPQPEKVKHISTWIAEDDDLTVPASIAMDVSEAGSGSLEATATGLMAGPVPVEMEEAVPGQVTILLSLPKPDIYTVHVSWAGLQVPDSPFTICTKPPDVTRIKTEGPVVVPTSGEVELDLFAGDAGRGKAKASVIGSLSGQVPVSISETAKDCYKLTFHPPQPDVYTFGVWYGRELVPDAPFFVNTHPPNASEVKVMQPDAIQCHKPVLYRCDASNAGSGELAVECVGEESGSVAVDLQRKGAAKYLVSLTFPRPDVYSLSITWAGKHVVGSPFRINLLPVDVSKIVVGKLIEPNKAGVDERVLLKLDCSRTGVGLVEANCHGEDVGEIPVVITSPRCEHYKISFNPEKADLYTLSVSYSGVPIAGSPFLINLIPPNPKKVKVLQTTVPDVIGTAPATLLLDTSKAGRGSLHAKGLTISTGHIPVDIKALGHGLHELHFTPFVPEVYQIVVSWADQPITGSPFNIDIRKPENARCVASNYTRAGEKASISVDIANAGPGKITAFCTGKKCGDVPLEVTLSSPTMYDVLIHPRREDIYTISVYYDDKEVPGSPFVIDLYPHTPVHEAMTMTFMQNPEEAINLPEELLEASTATGHPEETTNGSIPELTCYIGDPTVLTVESEYVIRVTAMGEKTGPASIMVIRNADGTSDVYFDPDKPDQYTVSVRLNDEEIPGSPFVIVYIMPVDPMKCFIFGLNDQPAISAVHQKIEFGVDASSAGDSKLQVTLSGPSGAGYQPKVTVTSDRAIYHIAYLPTASGVHRMHILWGGEHIPGSPIVFKVGAGNGLQVYECGKHIAMEVHCSSETGAMNAYSVHQQSGKKCIVDVSKSLGNGKCNLSLGVDEPGLYAVHLYISNKEAPGSPYFIECARRCDPTAVEVRGFNPTGTVKEPLRFTVDTRQAGTGDLKVRASGPSLKKGDFVVEENRDGTYSAVLIPNSCGEHQVHLFWSGQPVSGSPFKAQVSEGPAKPQSGMAPLQVEIHPDDKGIFGKELPFERPACFRISADKAGPGNLSIVTQGPGRANVRIDDNHDGVYTCVLTPTLPGEYMASIMWNKQHIPGSPYPIRFYSNQGFFLVAGLSLDGVKYLVGVPHRFSIHCGHGDLRIVCKPFNAAMIQVRPASQLVRNIGSYSCQITPTQVGNHKISVLYDGQHVVGSPFNVHFELPESTAASSYRIISKSIEATDQLGVFKAVFDISAPSQGDGRLSAIIEDTVTGEHADTLISETSKQHYQVQSTIQEGRQYHVSVKYEGQHIENSPFILSFGNEIGEPTPKKGTPRVAWKSCNDNEEGSGQINPDKVRAYGPGLENGHVGQEGNFTVETAEGGAGTLAVRVHGPKGAFKINMRHHPDSDRTILIRYDPTHVGQYTVDITWSDTHIPGSPFKVDILEQWLPTVASEDDLDQLVPTPV